MKKEVERESTRAMVRSALMVGALTLLSRITGLARVVLVAYLLGTTAAADAFRIGFLLPNLLRRLVGEGAVTSAFVPIYAERLEHAGDAGSRGFVEAFLTLWLGGLAVVSVLGVVLAGWLIGPVFGLGDDPERVRLTVEVTRIVFWYAFLVGGFAAGHGILTARGVFAPSAMAPILFNLGFIAAALLLAQDLPPRRAVFGVAFAVLAGGLLQLGFVAVPTWRAGVRLRPRNPWAEPSVRRVMRLLLPGTLGAGIYQINVVVTIAIASRLQEGSVSALQYSSLVMEFVLGIFVMALNTVGLTYLSRHAARGDHAAFADTVSDAVRLVLFITIPSLVGLSMLSDQILEMLFLGGQFDLASLSRTSLAFRYHVLGLPFIGVGRILVSSFHARKDLATPVRLALVSLAVGVPLAYVLSRTELGHAGVALASTLAALAHCLLFAWIYRRSLPEARLSGLGATLWKTTIATLIMAVACWIGRGWLPEDSGRWTRSVAVLALVVAGALVFVLSARALGARELETLTGGLFGRRQNRMK